jgi:hypothetical protein
MAPSVSPCAATSSATMAPEPQSGSAARGVVVEIVCLDYLLSDVGGHTNAIRSRLAFPRLGSATPDTREKTCKPTRHRGLRPLEALPTVAILAVALLTAWLVFRIAKRPAPP